MVNFKDICLNAFKKPIGATLKYLKYTILVGMFLLWDGGTIGPVSADAGVEGQIQQTTQNSNEIQKHTLSAVVFNGVTVFKTNIFADIYLPYLASPISLSDMETLVKKVIKKYHDEGYILAKATIAPQSLENGILQIDILEGYISKVTYKGDASIENDFRKYEKKLITLAPLHKEKLEHYIQTLNGLNGIYVKSTNLFADQKNDGSYILDLDISKDEYEANVYIDNRGPKSIGRIQNWIGLKKYSLFSTGDMAQIGAFYIPENPNKLNYLQLSYEGLLGTKGTKYNITIGRASSEYINESYNHNYDYKNYGVKLNIAHPIINTRKSRLWLSTTLNYMNSRQKLNQANLYRDKIRSVEFGALYQHNDEWNGHSNIELSIKQGLGIFGASNILEGKTSRKGADGKFTVGSLKLSRDQSITNDFSLLLKAKGQISNKPLLSSQEFILGGTEFARAYDNAEISGDDAFAASAEVRFSKMTSSVNIPFYQLYAFIDTGAVWNDNYNAKYRKQTLTSAGGGIRVNLLKKILTTVELAKPLNKNTFSNGNKDLRVFFSMTASF